MSSAVVSRPDKAEYAPSYSKYIELLPAGDILGVLEEQTEQLTAFFRRIPEAEAARRHPPYTWSVKEVVGHVTDAERVFGYRALCIARQDQTPLPGFDENAYVKNAGFDAYRLSDLAAEFEFLRRSHLCFFRGLPGAAWQYRGVANGNPVSVRALASIIAGHARHHELILRKRVGE
jgi:DinB superfamily